MNISDLHSSNIEDIWTPDISIERSQTNRKYLALHAIVDETINEEIISNNYFVDPVGIEPTTP